MRLAILTTASMVMVGDFAKSVLGGVMLSRLEPVVAEFGMEIQNGGVKGRGGMDAIFTLKQVLCKRRQHGQDAWGAFVDLKKAFPQFQGMCYSVCCESLACRRILYRS